MLRQPVVAGRFYSADPVVLRRDVDSYLSPREERQHAIACMVPHAGYMYSGQVAGAVFSRIEIPDRCVVLCPNHTGRGHPLAIMDEGEWKTPLGNIAIDSELAAQIINNFPALVPDAAAHQSEHAIEVELPFLQVLRPETTFVPIAIGTSRLMLLEPLGEALAAVINGDTAKQSERGVLIIASSDMNHYEDDATTRIKDRKALDKILALDPPGLHETVLNESISMCGFGPAIAMLAAAKRLGATRAELVQYATSGDVSGDRDMVVGYAGIVVT
ncbi:MAG TPA: AmmeMemoRadiSam system protein B [Terriglobales bacterium]|nr:AmmeMemoRadiSam system protein B [Terriglobales bacterium]